MLYNILTEGYVVNSELYSEVPETAIKDDNIKIDGKSVITSITLQTNSNPPTQIPLTSNSKNVSKVIICNESITTPSYFTSTGATSVKCD